MKPCGGGRAGRAGAGGAAARRAAGRAAARAPGRCRARDRAALLPRHYCRPARPLTRQRGLPALCPACGGHARCVGWRAVGAPGTAVAHLKCGQSDCAHTAAQYQSLLWPVPRTAKAAELLRVHCHHCCATEYPNVPQSACGLRSPGCPGCSHRQSAVCGDGARYSRWHVLRADPEGLDLCRPDWRQS